MLLAAFGATLSEANHGYIANEHIIEGCMSVRLELRIRTRPADEELGSRGDVECIFKVWHEERARQGSKLRFDRLETTPIIEGSERTKDSLKHSPGHPREDDNCTSPPGRACLCTLVTAMIRAALKRRWSNTTSAQEAKHPHKRPSRC